MKFDFYRFKYPQPLFSLKYRLSFQFYDEEGLTKMRRRKTGKIVSRRKCWSFFINKIYNDETDNAAVERDF